MYRRPKFLEKLLSIRRDMAAEADYDVELFAELARSGGQKSNETPAQAEPVAESKLEFVGPRETGRLVGRDM